MSTIIAKYKQHIQSLNPLVDSKYLYDGNKWNKLNNEAKTLVAVYQNKEITRNHVVKSFKQFYQGEKDYLFPFVMTMIWGFGNSGYGTFRTNKYLGSNENKVIIKRSFNYIADGDIKKAYHLLMKINGLNVSYVSKLLYFATRAKEQKYYTLIFDLRVARSLVKLSNPQISNILQISPSTKYIDFNNYNCIIHQWAKEFESEAENIEMFLFNGEF